MRLNFSLLLVLFSLLSFYAQDKPLELSHYVFPEFTPGQVLMKNGVKNIVALNYNTLSEEMIFEDNGMKLAIADEQLKAIDTVFIANRKFVRSEETFLELVASSPPLYIEYKCRIKYPGKVNGPGGRTSQTSSSETYTPTDFRRIIYEVVLPNGYDTNPYRYYWIEKDGALKKFKNLNQLAKVYPSKKSLFKAYLKKNDVAYNNQDSIVKLIAYLERFDKEQ